MKFYRIQYNFVPLLQAVFTKVTIDLGEKNCSRLFPTVMLGVDEPSNPHWKDAMPCLSPGHLNMQA